LYYSEDSENYCAGTATYRITLAPLVRPAPHRIIDPYCYRLAVLNHARESEKSWKRQGLTTWSHCRHLG